MTTIFRGLKKVFKSNRFNLKKSTKKGPKRNERSSKGRKFSNSNESNMGSFFGCGLPGHVMKNGQSYNIKSENESKEPRKTSRKQ